MEDMLPSDTTGFSRTRGLFIVFTGHGKGKTTAALGMTMRAAGHGMKICFIQFIKGSWRYGELDAIKRFSDCVDFYVMGRGFTWKSKDIEKDRAAARKAWDFAVEVINSGKYAMVVLDEFTYLPLYEIVNVDECTEVFRSRPEDLHIVITGRNALPEIIDQADLVTEMRMLKHPLDNGVKAQRGIEF